MHALPVNIASLCSHLVAPHRRMHRIVLETLFHPQHANQQQKQIAKDAAQHDSDSSTDDQQQQQQDPTAAAIAAVAAMCISPARLFAGLYGSNLLMNGSFLERLNSHKGPQRKLVWVSDLLLTRCQPCYCCQTSYSDPCQLQRDAFVHRSTHL